MIIVAHMKELRNQHRMFIGNPEEQAPFTRNRWQNKMAMSYTEVRGATEKIGEFERKKVSYRNS